MMRRGLIALAALLLGLVGRSPAYAADHTDGTASVLNVPDASSDITDVYAWMADATHVNLVMDVFPNAVTGSKFSNVVQYVFHTTAKAGLLATTSTPANVICTFDTTQKISRRIVSGSGTVLDFVTGDASATTGLSSADGKVKVFAGLRDDPFFFNLAGLRTPPKRWPARLQSVRGRGTSSRPSTPMAAPLLPLRPPPRCSPRSSRTQRTMPRGSTSSPRARRVRSTSHSPEISCRSCSPSTNRFSARARLRSWSLGQHQQGAVRRNDYDNQAIVSLRSLCVRVRGVR